MDARATCHQARARPLNMRSQARASQCATTCLLYLQTDYHFSTVFILFLFPFSTLHWCPLALCYPNNIKLTLFFRPNTRSFAHSLTRSRVLRGLVGRGVEPHFCQRCLCCTGRSDQRANAVQSASCSCFHVFTQARTPPPLPSAAIVICLVTIYGGG